MIGITASGFLLMILLSGTRRGERKAKLSSKDLGTLTELKLDRDVLDARITNVRVLYVVVEKNKILSDTLASAVCRLAKKNDALAEEVRVVMRIPGDSTSVRKTEAKYQLLDDCNCTPIRIK